MDFIKKNYGLILFLIACLAVIVYQVIGVVNSRALREEQRKKRADALEVLDNVRKSGMRLDDENKEKAAKVAEDAKANYQHFMDSIAEKRLLPGIDFSIDLDEPAENTAETPEATDEEGNSVKVISDYEKYKDTPNRILFDKWMKGSLVDSRNTLQVELDKLNEKAYTIWIYDEDEEEFNEEDLKGLYEAMPTDPAKEGQDDGKTEEEKKAEQEKLKAELEEKKAALKEKKTALMEKVKKENAGKRSYDIQKGKRTKILKGQMVDEYFMFTDYCYNRQQGLRSQKEKRGVFRNLLLFQKITSYLQKADIKGVEAIDFPTGIEMMEGDRYNYLPITMTIMGKPENIESFLNIINANEDYFFILRDITSFNAAIQINTDLGLGFNNGVDVGCMLLTQYITEAYQAANRINEPGSMAPEAASRGRRGGDPNDPSGMGMGGRRSKKNKAMQGMDGMGGPGMGPEQFIDPADLIPKTRKAFRVFAPKYVATNGNNMMGGMGPDMGGMGPGMMGGMGPGMMGGMGGMGPGMMGGMGGMGPGMMGGMGPGMEGSEGQGQMMGNGMETGTMVTVSLNIEYIEYKSVNE